ncbi:hypothetical protein D3C78_1383740 [compost metagenome]
MVGLHRRQVADAAAQHAADDVPQQVDFQQLVEIAHPHAALAAEVDQAGHLRDQLRLAQQAAAHVHAAPGVRHPVHRHLALQLADRRLQRRQVFGDGFGLAVTRTAADARRAAAATAQVGDEHVVAVARQIVRQPLAVVGIEDTAVGHHPVQQQHRRAILFRMADALQVQRVGGGDRHPQIVFAVCHDSSCVADDGLRHH